MDLDMYTHMASSHLDIALQIYWKKEIISLHLMASSVVGKHSAHCIAEIAAKFFDVIRSG